MFVTLNPRKAQSFTTKGMRLTPFRPNAWVRPDLEPEFLNRIYAAIDEGVLIDAGDGIGTGVTVPQIGSRDAVQHDENVATKPITIKKIAGPGGVVSFEFTIPDDAKVEDPEDRPLPPRIILTDFFDEHDVHED